MKLLVISATLFLSQFVHADTKTDAIEFLRGHLQNGFYKGVIKDGMISCSVSVDDSFSNHPAIAIRIFARNPQTNYNFSLVDGGPETVSKFDSFGKLAVVEMKRNGFKNTLNVFFENGVPSWFFIYNQAKDIKNGKPKQPWPPGYRCNLM